MMNSNVWLLIGIMAGTLSLVVAVYLYSWVRRQDAGSQKAQEVASWIRGGASSYLKKLYRALTLVAVVIGLIIAIVFSFDLANFGTGQAVINPLLGIEMALAFIAGAICSAIAGYMGMSIAVEANVRSATAASRTLNQAFRVAFYAGAVMGLAMVGIAVILVR